MLIGENLLISHVFELLLPLDAAHQKCNMAEYVHIVISL
jgi:hypothetical protein